MPSVTLNVPFSQINIKRSIKNEILKSLWRMSCPYWSWRLGSLPYHSVPFLDQFHRLPPGTFIYLFIYLLFPHNKDYTSITLYKDVARGPQKTTRLVRGGPLLTICLFYDTN